MLQKCLTTCRTVCKTEPAQKTLEAIAICVIVTIVGWAWYQYDVSARIGNEVLKAKQAAPDAPIVVDKSTGDFVTLPLEEVLPADSKYWAKLHAEVEQRARGQNSDGP